LIGNILFFLGEAVLIFLQLACKGELVQNKVDVVLQVFDNITVALEEGDIAVITIII
jgi:hypothetical protein